MDAAGAGASRGADKDETAETTDAGAATTAAGTRPATLASFISSAVLLSEAAADAAAALSFGMRERLGSGNGELPCATEDETENPVSESTDEALDMLCCVAASRPTGTGCCGLRVIVCERLLKSVAYLCGSFVTRLLCSDKGGEATVLVFNAPRADCCDKADETVTALALKGAIGFNGAFPLLGERAPRCVDVTP